MTPDQIRRDVETVKSAVIHLHNAALHLRKSGYTYADTLDERKTILHEAAERLATVASRIIDLPDDVREAMERRRDYDAEQRHGRGRDTYHGTPHLWSTDNAKLANYFLSLTEPKCRGVCDRCGQPLEMSRTIDECGEVIYYECECQQTEPSDD